jgi:antitoxin HicB
MKAVMDMDTNQALSPAAILKRPYHRVIVPEEDGSFSALISEFPGCMAVGDTYAEAYAILEEVAESWLLAVIANGQPIPEPEEESEYSGKLVLRLPKSLHRKAAHAAKRDGVSLNQFLVTALAIQVGGNEATQPRVTAVPVYNFVGAQLNVMAYTGPMPFGQSLPPPGGVWEQYFGSSLPIAKVPEHA